MTELSVLIIFSHPAFSLFTSINLTMHGLALFLPLFPSLAVADWSLKWFSDKECTVPLGRIERGDTTGMGPIPFDSDVHSFIPDFDPSVGEFLFHLPGGYPLAVDHSGACWNNGGDGYLNWKYEAKA